MYGDDIKKFVKSEKELEILIQTIRIYRQDMEIEFSIEKCIMLIMKIEKRETTTNQERFETLGEKENYKYLGILQADTIKHVEIKENLRKIMKPISATGISSQG